MSFLAWVEKGRVKPLILRLYLLSSATSKYSKARSLSSSSGVYQFSSILDIILYFSSLKAQNSISDSSFAFKYSESSIY